MISIVVAADEKGAIGAKNKIPWRLRDDLVRLKELTAGHTVILGRNTYESMLGYYLQSGRQMPGKTYIVVTHNTAFQTAESATRVVHSVEGAIAEAKACGDEDIYIIGGAQIYAATLAVADRIYLTEVHTKFAEADAYFPVLDPSIWEESTRTSHAKDDRNEFDFDLVTYDRGLDDTA